jgi:hypothetical protein
VSNPLLWLGLWAAHVKITISVIANLLNYCAVFTVHIWFRNVAMGCELDIPDLEGAGWEVYFHKLIKVG